LPTEIVLARGSDVTMAAPTLVSVESKEKTVNRLRLHLAILTAFFVATLPLVNPLVHGDGVGYYAFLRAPLIQHNLRFEEDWRHGNLAFAESRLNSDNQLKPNQYTSTGYIGNLFTIGPAILWSPFFMLAHVTVLVADWFGAQIPADGFSLPYRVLVAVGTAFYGFWGLLLSYLLARKFVKPLWAFLATLGIWLGSGLPVYMYFNPFWSHAHSAFIVALFLWYWDHTRPNRTLWQWVVLGLISGLLVDVYFVNGVFLLIPFGESLRVYVNKLILNDGKAIANQFALNLVYLTTFGVVILPTLLTRKIIFGGMLRFGSYTVLPWNWRAPYWSSVLFSSDHGMLTWTPLLGFALVGLLIPHPACARIKTYFVLAAGAFYYVISSYPYWDGMSSYGNRFFVSLTPVFVFGLALLLDRVGGLFRSIRLAYATQSLAIGLFVLWNLAFIFQWGTHMVPVRGKIVWSSMVHQQIFDVPLRITHSVETYFTRRGEMMQNIEHEDIEQQKIRGASEN
jgi:hypothetical protein